MTIDSYVITAVYDILFEYIFAEMFGFDGSSQPAQEAFY